MKTKAAAHQSWVITCNLKIITITNYFFKKGTNYNYKVHVLEKRTYIHLITVT